MDTGTPLTNRIGVSCFVLSSMNLTSAFARPKGQEEYRLEDQMLQGKEASLIGSNGALFSWCKTSERFQEGMPHPAFGSVSVETIQETSEIVVLADVEG